MPWEEVELVISRKCRGYCKLPYPGHPKGCPNYGVKPTCPPKREHIEDLIVTSTRRTTWVIYTVFDLQAHVSHMKALHPRWSYRQAACCLYWQAGARRNLEREISRFLAFRPYSIMATGLKIVRIPEATGVDVTATMKSIGIILEWPPKRDVYQVAVAGFDS